MEGTMSIRGMASGMDIDNIVDQLIQLERRPIRQQEARISGYQKSQKAWQEINSQLYNLRQANQGLLDLRDSRVAISSREEVLTADTSTQAQEGNYNINVLALAQNLIISSENALDSEPGVSGNFTINGAEVSIEEGDTLYQIRDAINQAQEGVRASIVNNHLVLEDQAGTGIEFGGDTDILQELELITGEGDFSRVLQEQQDAQVEINGLLVESSSNVLEDVIEGVTINLHDLGQSELQVGEDLDKQVKQIQEFVDAYNKAASQMAQMSDRGGQLQGDTLLTRLRSNIRTQIMNQVGDGETNDGINHLGSLGINIDWQTGQMSLDETELRNALEENSEAVRNLFQAREEYEGFQGIGQRLEGLLHRTLRSGDGSITMRERYYDQSIERAQDRIATLERRVEQTRARLIRQFGAMENAIGTMNSQSMWLSQQIDQMGL